MNIHISAVNISKKEKRGGKDDITTTFAWSKTTKPKEHDDIVVTSLTYHCVGVMAKLHPENHVTTCITDLAEFYTEEKKFWLYSCCQC